MEICKDYSTYISLAKLAEKYGCGTKRIKTILKKNNIELMGNIGSRVFTKDQEEIICDLYEEGQTMASISLKFGVYPTTISRVLKRNKIKVRDNVFYRTKYKFNINFFDTIDTEDKAYWLGFIYADGFVDKNKNMGISLAIVDKSHLEKFKVCIDSNHPINEFISVSGYSKGKPYVRIMLNNAWFYQQCLDKGILPNKTEILTFPKEDVLPKYLAPHFIRGYFDGDGCLTHHIPKGNKKNAYCIKIVGTKEILQGINNELPFDKTFNLSKRWKDDKNNYNLEIGGNKQVGILLDYLYRDCSVYLERKFNHYKQYIEEN